MRRNCEYEKVHQELRLCKFSGGLILVSVATSFAQEMPSPAQYDTLREYEISTGEEITSFKEAPVLAKLVEDGEIPPLGEIA